MVTMWHFSGDVIFEWVHNRHIHMTRKNLIPLEYHGNYFKYFNIAEIAEKLLRANQTKLIVSPSTLIPRGKNLILFIIQLKDPNLA